MLATAIYLVYPRVEPELRCLDDVCGRGGVMIDVGAWYGPWSRRLARRAQRLIAIEPTSRHRILRRILPANAEVIAAAAADREGHGELWMAAAGDGAEGLASMRRRDIHGASVKVPLIRVDDLGLDGVTFVKIDVEGHEVPVLRGAEATIRRDRPRLLVEVESRMQPVGSLIALVTSWGYRGWVLHADSWQPLAGFDLAGRQAATLHVAQRGLLRTVLWPYPRYVNSVLFLPEAESPGG
jgi:FkbM family methyltransferase